MCEVPLWLQLEAITWQIKTSNLYCIHQDAMFSTVALSRVGQNGRWNRRSRQDVVRQSFRRINTKDWTKSRSVERRTKATSITIIVRPPAPRKRSVCEAYSVGCRVFLADRSIAANLAAGRWGLRYVTRSWILRWQPDRSPRPAGLAASCRPAGSRDRDCTSRTQTQTTTSFIAVWRRGCGRRRRRRRPAKSKRTRTLNDSRCVSS